MTAGSYDAAPWRVYKRQRLAGVSPKKSADCLSGGDLNFFVAVCTDASLDGFERRPLRRVDQSTNQIGIANW
jgi:hypothetical protein